jgi:hypothetical protein
MASGRDKKRDPAVSKRVGAAWSPVRAGRGFSSTRAQAQSFYAAVSGDKKLALSTITPRGGGRPLSRADFGPGGRLNTVDLLYFAGHGSQSGLRLDGEGASTFVHASEVRAWGAAGGLQWAALDACDTLNPAGDPARTIARWRPAFRGLHGLLGFASPILSWPGRGATFAELLDRGEPLLAAWKMACEETEGALDGAASPTWACLQVTDQDTSSDRWTGPRAEVAEARPRALRLVTRPC